MMRLMGCAALTILVASGARADNWPRFFGENGTGIGTQDLYFWGDARKYGYRCAIDCSVKVGHYDLEGRFGPPDTMW